MKTTILLLIAGVAVTGCSSCKGTSVPPAGTDCVAACQNMQRLQCHGIVNGDPTPQGKPCTVWRCNTPDATERTTCIAHATSCDDAISCLKPVSELPPGN